MDIIKILNKLETEGAAPGLINDDNGHWALTCDGVQTVNTSGGPQEILTTFFVEEQCWKPTIEQAIQYFLNKNEDG